MGCRTDLVSEFRGFRRNKNTFSKMAYSWENRVKYIVRYMYDIDNNGLLDKNDFECLAVRVTLIEARGEFPAEAFAANKKVMAELWNEIAELADFDKDGEVTNAFKTFIGNQFKTIDVNGDGIVGLDEYRLDCITRSAFADVKEIDDVYAKLCSPDDVKVGGIGLARYQELYSQFISKTEECPACYLFGPLKPVA